MDGNKNTKIKNFAVGPSSHTIICPHCGESVQTRVEFKPTLWTYILSCVLCPILCCCLPCLCGCCLHINQHCPNCDTYIGTYTRKLLSSEN